MYIAGIHVANDSLTEGIVTSSLFTCFVTAAVKQRRAMKTAREKGGQIKSMPTTPFGKLVTPLHGAAMILPSVTYLIAIPFNGGVQPAFIARLALPNFGAGEGVVNLLRVAGCVGLAGTWKMFSLCLDALGQSFHFIGVRERPKITSSGPYAIVRHPLYTVALAQQLVLSIMFWNYIPLCSLVLCAGAFAVKIPIEESLIESNPELGPEYAEYKKKVTYRLIPRVW